MNIRSNVVGICLSHTRLLHSSPNPATAKRTTPRRDSKFSNIDHRAVKVGLLPLSMIISVGGFARWNRKGERLAAGRGYYCEIARTFSLGTPTAELKAPVQTAIGALDWSLERLKPGTLVPEIAAANDAFLAVHGQPPERRLYPPHADATSHHSQQSGSGPSHRSQKEA